MAHYQINHQCGHVARVQLFGKQVERERKIKWLEQNDCADCAKEAALAKAKADETPVHIEVYAPTKNVVGISVDILLIAKGGTYRERENLSELGFGYGDIPFDRGIRDFLSPASPRRAWYKVASLKLEDFTNPEALALALGAKRQKIGEYPIEWKLNDIDIQLLINGLKVAKEKADAAAARKAMIGKSAITAWMEQKNLDKDKWNGKLYGNDRYGYRLYVDGAEHKIPADVMAAQVEWRAHRDKIDAQLEKEKEGVAQ
jgi:hypothetical protein